MKKIGFLGAYDKTDLIVYIAKLITMTNKKVLVVDATSTQKARYIVPAINPTKAYITDYEDIDIAVGFSNMEDIQRYLGIAEQKEMEYDIMLVDTDNYEGFKNFGLKESKRNYFVTSFDNYSLKRGLETLNQLKEVTTLTKVLYAKEILKDEDDYLNFLSLGYKIVWDDERIYFPIENGDLSVIHENQRIAKIRFKKLSVQYKESLILIAQEIIDDPYGEKIRKVLKSLEKGVW